jgi:hypothetical protein
MRTYASSPLLDEEESEEFVGVTPQPTAWYGLARTLPAVLDDPLVRNFRSHKATLTHTAARAIAAQEAVGDLLISTLIRADMTLDALDEIRKSTDLASAQAEFEEFHHSQRSQYLAQMSEIALRATALILAQLCEKD